MKRWNDKSDTALLEHIQQGSHHAFSVLVTRHTTRFFRLAYRYVAQKESAEDIVQQCFLTLWEKPHRFDARKKVIFTTWFSRVIINRSLDLQRKMKPVMLDAERVALLGADNQEADLMAHEEAQTLEKAIQSLPKRQQNALNLCYSKELNNVEAAEIMQCSLKSVESLLVRAKKSLRKALQKPPSALPERKAGR